MQKDIIHTEMSTSVRGLGGGGGGGVACHAWSTSVRGWGFLFFFCCVRPSFPIMFVYSSFVSSRF